MLPQIVTVNPLGRRNKVKPMAKHRRRAKHKRAHNRFRHRARGRTHNRVHRRRRSRHHNPFSIRGMSGSIMPALIGAGGAIGTDIAMAYAAPYLPAMLQTGWANILARAGAALGVGYIAGKVAGSTVGKEVAAGGLIVVAYSALKTALAPTLGTSIKGLSGLADFGDYAPAYSAQSGSMVGQGMGAYMGQPRIGAYMQPRLGAYMNPAAFVGAGGAAASPIRAKQMGRFGGFGSFGSAMDSSSDELAGM